ncbi:GUC2C protein, partial [Polypterus senegalus]|nr:heat-stable enterotoxin receptor isoform X1 [Polypterus senegalus]MBN3293117.1 GUC2C protein [Polypterus senegalus]
MANHLWGILILIGIFIYPSIFNENCKNGRYTLNVILLDDNVSLWSKQKVESAVNAALKFLESNISTELNISLSLNATYHGFDTALYQVKGCPTSTCEGVEILKNLLKHKTLGCVLIGPTCTYATFQMFSLNSSLSMPQISAGSFGLSCDFKSQLTRILPPARKLSTFMIEFWRFISSSVKPHQWTATYTYKKNENPEEFFWYMNALEAGSADFAINISIIEIIRTRERLYDIIKDPLRKSNVIIMCGTPEEVQLLLKGQQIASEIVFVLVDIYNHIYYSNTTSAEVMRNVLVVTVPPPQQHDNNSGSFHSIPLENDFVTAYVDGVMLFGSVLRNYLSTQKEKAANSMIGEYFVQLFRNTTFQGISGEIHLDEYGDRDVNFTILYTTTDTLKYTPLLQFDTSKNETKVLDSKPRFIWTQGLPQNAPSSGPHELMIAVITLAVVVCVVLLIALIVLRQYRKERHIHYRKWSHIPPDKVTVLDTSEMGHVSLKIDDDRRKDSTDRIHRGRYDKKIVILKELPHVDSNFSENQKIELNKLLLLDYNNLTKFYGTTKLDMGLFSVTEYCERGSLRHVLNDRISYPEETFMDLEFKISVMTDIAKGMSYLHSSKTEVHGRLKSTNCVVDSRMVVKITDFGYNSVLPPQKNLWLAPEHLRQVGISQKGDVYSFGIIAQEIIQRRETFYTEACSNHQEKLYRVQHPRKESALLRPDLDFEKAGQKELELYLLVKSCWEEDPEKRPDFKKIESTLSRIFSNLNNEANETYMDTLIRRLQMYSRNLEHLVEERTALYKAERDRADQLNLMLLPRPVVRSLKETGRVEPELFEEVTIYFSDIVGFTTLCQYSTPIEVVDMLNDVYKNFDHILDNHDVYKVETIGDAYMVVSGLPRRNGNRHAVDISLMALDILSFVGTFKLQHLPGLPMWIRIGIHSGPCAAGVVGIKMPRYCLFGDTVNTASRMESTGLPLRIHMSQSTVNILQRTKCKFEFTKRGPTYLKGKGTEITYWLTGVKDQTYNLPTPPTAENFQGLQEDFSELLASALKRRAESDGHKSGTLSRHQCSGSYDDVPLEYLQLATSESFNTYF